MGVIILSLFANPLWGMDQVLPSNKRMGEVPSTKVAYSTYLDIAWPASMQGLMLSLMISIDLVMVGGLGAGALAAVGIMSQPRMVMLAFVRALAVPITAMVARRKGEERYLEMNAVLKQSLLLGFLFYIPFLALSIMYMPEILTFAGAQPSILEEASTYGVYIVFSLFFSVFSQIIGAALVGVGHTKIIFKANVIGNITNTVLNFFLIYGVWIFPKLGVAGAGIATLICNVVTAFILGVVILDKKQELNLLDASSWKFTKEVLHGIKHIGGSSLGEQAFERFGMLTYTMMVASLGVIPLATHHVCMSLCDVFYMFAMGLSYAGASLTGQNLGRKRADLAEAYGKIGLWVGLVASIGAFLIYVLGRYPLMGLYTQDPEVLALGAEIIIIMAIASFPQTAQQVCSGVLKGAGDSYYVMLYSLFVIAIFRPILTYVLCFTLSLGLYGAWLALICDQSLRMCFSFVRFYSGAWKHISI